MRMKAMYARTAIPQYAQGERRGRRSPRDTAGTEPGNPWSAATANATPTNVASSMSCETILPPTVSMPGSNTDTITTSISDRTTTRRMPTKTRPGPQVALTLGGAAAGSSPDGGGTAPLAVGRDGGSPTPAAVPGGNDGSSALITTTVLASR